MSISVVIDTDPGVDDVLAILMAIRSPEIDLKGLTVVGGNTSLENGVANALRILEAEGRSDVPVIAGASDALAGPFRYADEFHGPTGLTLKLPRAQTSPAGSDVAGWLSAHLMTSIVPVTVLPVGPLTNIARFLNAQSGATGKIQRLIVMGGALDCPGNATDAAEFNIWNDPEAADQVLRSGMPTTLIGLDVCNEVAFTRQRIESGKGIGRDLMESWFDSHPDRDEFHLCDPLAMAVAIDPSIVETEAMALSVDTTDGPERGRTKRAPDGPPVDVALRVDRDRAIELISKLAL